MSSTDPPRLPAAPATKEELIARFATERFVRSPGPGGQNVNKVATAVELRFDVAASPLPGDVKQRLAVLAGRRLNQQGTLVIVARRHRERERNRQDARARLLVLLERAAVAPRRRRATKPGAAARARRRDDKTRRGRQKRLRTRVAPD